MRILITGSSGWLGGALAERLVEDGHTVVGASRRSTLTAGVESRRVDINEDSSVSNLFLTGVGGQNFDVVVHLAGALGWCDLKTALDTNVAGTRRILETALTHGCRKFVVASSVAAISTAAPDHPPIELPMPANHMSVGGPWPYGLSKAFVEDFLKLTAKTTEVDIICVRIGNTVTDPPEVVHHDGKGITYAVAPASCSAQLEGDMIFPEAALCSVAFSDQVRCLFLAATRPRRKGSHCDVIACVAPKAYSAEPVADLFCAWYGQERASTIKGIETYKQPGGERRPVYDLSAAYNLLGWKPLVDLTQDVPLTRRRQATKVFLDIEKHVKPQQQETWLTLARTLASQSRSEAGCLFYDVVRVHESQHTFRIIECWCDEGALQSHWGTSHFRELLPVMDALSDTTVFHKGVDALVSRAHTQWTAGAAAIAESPAPNSPSVCANDKIPVALPPWLVGKVLVLYDSSTSCTKTMAHLVAEGCGLLDRTEVRVRAVPGQSNHWDDVKKLVDCGVDQDATFDDVVWADGVACGTPTNLGCVSWRFKKFFDDFSQAGFWGRCDGKIGCAFSSVGGTNGGAELACQAVNAILMNFGFACFGVTDYVGFKTTLHYGAICAKAPRDELDKMCCRRLGLRLAEFVGNYIVHRRETHPLLASKARDARCWHGLIPPRSASADDLYVINVARFVDRRPVCLIFSRALMYVHQSTPAAVCLLASLAESFGLRPVITSAPEALSPPNEYDIIFLVNLSGQAFDPETPVLTDHLAAGKGILGLHAAIACFLDGEDASGEIELGHTSEAIANMFGCHFRNHPPAQSGTVAIHRETLASCCDALQSLAMLPGSVQVFDEFFNFDRHPEDITVLASLVEDSYAGSTMGADHPIIWTKESPGRVFYCGLGHFDYSYASFDTLVAQFLAAGVGFTAGIAGTIREVMSSPKFYEKDGKD